MYAINKNNKLPIVSVVERIYGHASLEDDGFERDTASGEIKHSHAGETKMFWDTSETVTRNGQVLYIDDEDNEVTAEHIELVDQLPTAPTE